MSVALVLCVTAAIASGPEHPVGAAGRILFTQIPLQEANGAPEAFLGGRAAGLPDGSRVVLFDTAAPAAGARNLTAGFAAAGRPDLSFDGTRILFVARRVSGDPLNVWEMGLDGEAPRQITRREEDCAQAIYLSSLYTLDAVAPERRIAYCVDDGEERGPGVACSALYTCRMDGSETRKITFNPYGVGDPYLLADGRLLYVSARPPEAGGGTALFTVHPDGTDVSVFAAAHEPAAVRSMPSAMADDSVVYVEADAVGPVHGGALIAVNRARSLHGRRVVAGGDGGTYRSPSALPGGEILVSYRPTGGETYGIYVLDPRHADLPVEWFDARDRHDVDAVAVRRRDRPAGRSSVVDEASEHGSLYCMDAHLSDREAARGIERGSIATVRVFEAHVGRQAAGAPSPGRLLAEVPVRADGSFYLRLPARRPLRLETTDAAGELLQAMENWIWVMPNEQRGCIGCHEDRERTPPNRHPLALRAQPHSIDRGETSEDSAGDQPAHGERRE